MRSRQSDASVSLVHRLDKYGKTAYYVISYLLK